MTPDIPALEARLAQISRALLNKTCYRPREQREPLANELHREREQITRTLRHARLALARERAKTKGTP